MIYSKVSGMRLTRNHVLLLTTLIATALLIRLYAALSGGFFLDQGMYFDKAAQLALSGVLEPTGPGSYERLGGLFGPSMWFLYALPIRIHATPLSCSIYLALVNFAVVFLLFYLGKILFSLRAGLIAGFLYAFLPYPIINTISIWEQPFLPLIYTVFLIGLFKCIQRERSPWIIVCLFMIGITCQLRIESYALIPMLFAAIAVFRIRVSPRYAVLGLFLAALLYVPYIAYELTHHYENTRFFLSQKSGRFGPKLEVLKLIPWSIIMSSADGINLFGKNTRAAMDYFMFFSAFTAGIAAVFLASYAAIIASFVSLGRTIVHGIRTSTLFTFANEHPGTVLIALMYCVQIIFQLIMLYPVDFNYAYQYMPITMLILARWIDRSLSAGLLARIPQRVILIAAIVFTAHLILIDMRGIARRMLMVGSVYKFERAFMRIPALANGRSFSVALSGIDFHLPSLRYVFQHAYPARYVPSGGDIVITIASPATNTIFADYRVTAAKTR